MLFNENENENEGFYTNLIQGFILKYKFSTTNYSDGL